MSAITSLLAYETLPSLLTVTGAISIVVSLMKDRVCDVGDAGCSKNIDNVRVAGIISSSAGVLMGILAMLGVMSFGEVTDSAECSEDMEEDMEVTTKTI